MHTALWIVQIVLTVKLLSVTWTHGINPNSREMKEARQKMINDGKMLLMLSAITTLIAGAGLILPMALKLYAWLTPLAALFSALLMIISILPHKKYREHARVFTSLILFLLSLFAAYGRWSLLN